MSPERQELVWIAGMTLALFALAAICFGWAAWSLGASILGWMKYGQWDHATIGDMLWTLGRGRPALSWVGLDGLLQWVLKLPEWVGLVPVGAWAAYWCQQCSNDSDRLAKTVNG